MRKILSMLIVLMTAVTSFAAETMIWEGSVALDWAAEPGVNVALSKDLFATAAVGDIIKVEGTTTDGAQVKICINYPWKESETVSVLPLNFTIETAEDLASIQSNGMQIQGQQATITKVSITSEESGGETTETDLTVQDGSAALPLTLLSDWSAYTTFAASQFAKAQEGDIITIYIEDVLEGAQLSLKDMSDGWPALDESTQYPSVATTDTKFTYTLTEESAAKVKANGLVVGGQLLTVTRVTLTTAGGDTPVEPVASESYTAWTGEKVFTNTWEVWEQIPASAFAQAQAGMLLRAKFKDVGAGAQIKFGDSTWEVLTGTEIVNISGKYQQFSMTADMLTALQSGGLIISGTSFTLTAVEVINPADLKLLTLTVPVTSDDWVFENEAPTFTIHAVNPYDEAVVANAVVEIATDKMVAVTTMTKEVTIPANGTEDIEFTWTEPAPVAGFYKATCYVNDDLARAFFFGVNPTEIASPADKQDDFDSFWQAAKNELAAVEATDEPVLTKIESRSTDKRTVYLVEFKSVSNGDGQPVTVRGYYAEPNDGKKHPVLMHYQGYDSGYRPGGQDATPMLFYGDGDDFSGNYAEFVLSTRGQSINNRPAADRADGIDRDFTNEYGDWFAYNFGNKDGYYYRGAYMDCVRAIDFMASRSTSDMTNLYAEGQSQGGAFTYAAAALSGREFKAIAPGIAFMGDFPDYFEIVNWPAYVARENQGTMTDAEMYAFLSYFDTKNLATLISSNTAVIATIGVQDNVCPPHTNIAPYNNLPAGTTKEITFNPENGHQVANSWYSDYMTYFANKYVEPQPEPVAYIFDEDGVADLSKFEVQNAEKVSYDAETHTMTTTEGWTGIQLTVADGEEVSGEELRITFTEPTTIKLYVKYMDETDADVIMSDPAEILYFTLDKTKKLYQIQVQPTDAATITFKEVKVNQESTKPVVKPLEEGENRVIFENAEGTVMSWNEIAQMNEEWGGILESGEYFLVTVKSRTEGSEWPKVILRDATSTEVSAIELADVTEYPYLVKMVLTDAMLQQLKDGFRFSGDGVVITKIELCKPAAAKEGDISITAMNWFRDAMYDAEIYLATTTARWGQFGWQVGDDRYADKTLVIVNIESTTFPVTLKMEYNNTENVSLATSVGVPAGKTQINLPLPLDTKVINKVYLTYSEPVSVVMTDASVVAGANARPLTGESDITTDIERVEIQSQQTVDGPIYNLNGQRVETLGKGLYIVNGHKMVIK